MPMINYEHTRLLELRLRIKARILQRAWRHTFSPITMHKICATAMRDGMTSFHAVSVSFERLVKILREPPVIKASKDALARMLYLSLLRHGPPPSARSTEWLNVRVVLSAYMIAHFLLRVFANYNTQERTLNAVATRFIEAYENMCRGVVCSRCFSGLAHDATSGFADLLKEYLTLFKAWKIPDEAKLNHRIEHALHNLYVARDHIVADVRGDNTRILEEFDIQIARLRDKLEQINGPGTLERYDARRMQPGYVPPANPDSEAAEPDPEALGPIGARGASSVLPCGLTANQLLHELLLDIDFSVDPNNLGDKDSPIIYKLNLDYSRADWDEIVRDITSTPPRYDNVLSALSVIEHTLAEITSLAERTRLKHYMKRPQIARQIRSGTYSWRSSTELIEKITIFIERTQAPERDAETAALWADLRPRLVTAAYPDQARAFADALSFITGRINVMRCDIVNKSLNALRFVARAQGPAVELDRFLISVHLERTRIIMTEFWLAENTEREIRANKVPLQQLLDKRPRALRHVYAAAVVALVTCGPSVSVCVENCPETLVHDAHRLWRACEETKHIVAATTILSIVRLCLAATHTDKDAAVLAAITDHLLQAKPGPNTLATALSEVEKALAHSTLEEAEQASVVRLVRMFCDRNASPCGTIARRIREAITASVELDKPVSLDSIPAAKPLVPRIAAVAATLGRILRLNTAVHGDAYRQIVWDCAQEAQPF